MTHEETPPEETPHGGTPQGTSAGEATPRGRPAAGEGERDGPPTGRQALLAGMWPPRVNRGQLLVAVLLFVLGLGLAIQVQAASGEDGVLRGARPEDLVRILSDLEDRTDRLEDERDQLEAQRRELENSSDQAEEARRQTEERRRQLGVLAGTVPAEGPGIRLRISDPQGVVEADRLLDAVQELRAAGAEALQINEARVVASTSFTDDNGGVRVDGRRTSPPYVIDAIGRPRDLEPALNIPGGVVQSLEGEGAGVAISIPEAVSVDALRSVEPPDYAQSSP